MASINLHWSRLNEKIVARAEQHDKLIGGVYVTMCSHGESLTIHLRSWRAMSDLCDVLSQATQDLGEKMLKTNTPSRSPAVPESGCDLSVSQETTDPQS